MIRELRILPPLAIGRFGAAPTPMDNYDVVVDPDRPLGPRTLQVAETLEVDVESGEIVRAFVPERLSFTEAGQVRPVAPFLEVWALADSAELEPLTRELLQAEGASPSDLRWQVRAGNLKVYRRTGDARDRVKAKADGLSDHVRQPLEGKCRNFWPGRTLPLGHVQYIKPTDAHPEIRLRFTPAPGHVYGSSESPPGEARPNDPNIVAAPYDANRGGWRGHVDRGPQITVPRNIFASRQVGEDIVSLGYLDDGCDGIVRVELTLGDRTLAATARFAAGPPTYAPDSLPVRTVADELEQALLGPAMQAEEASLERVEEIVRRAFETLRLMNTAAMNTGGMVGHDVGQGRRRDPIMAPSLVDEVALENLHEGLLVALRGGTAPWFADVLRTPEEIGDLSDRGRRKMPAMMRGADGRHLTLSRRQIDLIRNLVGGPIFLDGDGGGP